MNPAIVRSTIARVANKSEVHGVATRADAVVRLRVEVDRFQRLQGVGFVSFGQPPGFLNDIRNALGYRSGICTGIQLHEGRVDEGSPAQVLFPLRVLRSGQGEQCRELEQ